MANDNGTTVARKPSPAEIYFGRLDHIARESLSKIVADPKAVARVTSGFRTAATTAKNPQAFFDCSPGSIMKCMADCASTKLYPSSFNTPVWLIPKKGELYVWLNHRGIFILAERVGKHLTAQPVFTHDEFELDYGNETLRHVPGDGEQTWETLRGVWLRIRDIERKEAPPRIVYMTKAEIDKRRRKSDNPNSGPWAEWPIEQAFKTIIKYAANRGYIAFDEAAMELLSRDAESSPTFSAEDFAVEQRSTPGAMGAIRKAIAEKFPPVVLDEPAGEPARQDHGAPTAEEAAELLRLEREQAAREAAERRAAEQGDDEGMA